MTERSSRSLGASALLAAALGMAVLAGGGEASAQGRAPIECGSIYTVVRGDTLHEIAVRAYGEGRYLEIFEANRDYLPSPRLIEVGDRLLVPCLDGRGPRTRAEALAAEAAPRAPETASPEAQPEALGTATGEVTRLVALAQMPPYVGQRLPEGGMMTELVSRAVLRSATPVEYEIVLDDAAVTGELSAIAGNGYDLGYPAEGPECGRVATLTPDQRAVCDAYLFSAPVAEGEHRVYVAAGGALAGASRFAAFEGQRVCRVQGAGGTSIEAVAGVATTAAPRVAGCLGPLLAGEVDAMIAPGLAAEAAIAARGAGAEIAELAELRRDVALRVASPRGNAAGAAFIATLDAGLDDMRRSGEWSAVVENHIELQRRSF